MQAVVRPGGSTQTSSLHGCDDGPESALHAATLLGPSASAPNWLYSFRAILVSLDRWAGTVLSVNRSFLILLLHLSYLSLALHIKTTLSPRDHRLSFLDFYTLFHEALPGSCSSVYHHQLEQIQSFLLACEVTVSIP